MNSNPITANEGEKTLKQKVETWNQKEREKGSINVGYSYSIQIKHKMVGKFEQIHIPNRFKFHLGRFTFSEMDKQRDFPVCGRISSLAPRIIFGNCIRLVPRSIQQVGITILVHPRKSFMITILLIYLLP